MLLSALAPRSPATFAGRQLASWLTGAPRHPSDERAARIVAVAVESTLSPDDGYPAPTTDICFAILWAVRSAFDGSTTNESACTLAGWLAGDESDDDDARRAVSRECRERGGEFVGEPAAITSVCMDVLAKVRAAFPVVAGQLGAAA